MGKIAGAALAVAAPEAAGAGKLASAAGGGKGRRRPVPDPRVAAPGSKAAAQRQAIEDLKASRAPGHPMVPAPASSAPSSPGGGPPSPSLPSLPMPAAAATGSGFLLGVFAWALALAYLQHGPKGVATFLAAKFLNQEGHLT